MLRVLERALPGQPAALESACTGHTVWFYEGNEYPADRIAAYLHEGISAGHAALIFATQPHLEAINNILRQLGTNVVEKWRAGQIVMRDAREIANAVVVDGRPNAAVFDALVAQSLNQTLATYGGARAYGEIVDVLSCAGDQPSALQLERWWNKLLESHPGEPARLVCSYALDSFADAASVPNFRRISAEHSHVEPVGGQPMQDSGRLTAELQQSSAALLTEARERERVEKQRDRLLEAEHLARVEAQMAAAQLSHLLRLTAALSEVSTRSQISRVVTSDLAEVFGADFVLLALPTTEDAMLRLIEHSVLSAEQLAAFDTPLDSPLALATVFRSSRPLWVTSHAIAEQCPAVVAVLPEARTFGCLPLMLGEDCLGVIGLGFRGAYDPADAEHSLLDDYAKQITVALDRARSYERAQSERARAEQECERAELERRRAEFASRAKDEFLAMLGHELRNPLSPILTAVQLMQLRAGDVLAKERAIIERQVNHMVRLVDDLLDVSRIARGKVELKRCRVELAVVVARALEIAGPILEERSHHLAVSVPPSGLMVDADEDRLAQVIVNLLTNAAKYTPPQGRVEILARAQEDRVSLTVCDTGVGINAELLPRVFDLFIQGRQPSDRPQGGLGLGLAIARNLVQMHGGALVAQSEGQGKGSQFTLDLPLVDSQSSGDK